MKRILMYIPSWEQFLLYIGGIPSLFTAGAIAIMAFFTARNKAFSLTDLRTLRSNNKTIINKEDNLRKIILASPRGMQYLYRKWIGEMNYHYLINRR